MPMAIHTAPGGIVSKRSEEVVARAASLLLERAVARARARWLRQLSDDQLVDIGIDRSQLVPPKPIIQIKAGTMCGLMSMR